MTVRARLLRWQWQAYVALTMLAALLLPSGAEAACPPGDLSTPHIAASYSPTVQAAPAAQETPQPAEKPASRPCHATICQHAHCSHSQVAPEAGANLMPGFRVAGLRPQWTYDRLIDGHPAAGPERPPQA